MNEKIKINGLELHVASQDEIVEKADQEQLAIACLPTKFGPTAVEGSKIVDCEDCKQKVWISPATYSMWQSCAAPIVCVECLVSELKNKEK